MGKSFVSAINLEFYQRKRRKWPLTECIIPWEVWELNLEIVKALHNEDFSQMRGVVGEKLGETVIKICELINKPQYLPKIPARSELSSIYDDRLSDCQPYLFRIEANHGKPEGENLSKGGFMRKLLKDTLTYTNG